MVLVASFGKHLSRVSPRAPLTDARAALCRAASPHQFEPRNLRARSRRLPPAPHLRKSSYSTTQACKQACKQSSMQVSMSGAEVMQRR
ncbi:hypothetical protein MSG28_009395 [Choristoneura fumiferana]|uniref:Uncharacterized protein n=1 Tax=Choristoneura fumiferana TaxID=7141 RepID=A0ACC0KXC3_CHOFU|nr:hypothetical protein MSG28_009395 [Choristoneura fumiferana]